MTPPVAILESGLPGNTVLRERPASAIALRASMLLTLGVLSLLTGCATAISPDHTPAASPVISASTLTGSVHGGQQPVGGASLQMYEVSNAGYFSPSRAMFSTPVLSTAAGNFTFPTGYTCTAGNQVYLVATGGNPGLAPGTNNSALALMAAVGSCSNLLQHQATLSISVNELTTVASAWSLARFMSSATNAGTSSSNASGLANAFANIANVVNQANGKLPGSTLPAGATLPTAEINTLADILSACINTDGDLLSGSPCAQLFTAATPAQSAAPTDTITAALNIARNPSSNVAALYRLVSGAAPFQPTLPSAPDNWLIGIRYTGAGLAQPAALAIDAAGDVWTANTANNSASKFTSSGAAISPAAGYTASGLAGPTAIAIDASGNAWLANHSGSSITGLTPAGAAAGTMTTNLAQPNGIAFDASGNFWISSPGTGSLVEFGPNRSFLIRVPLPATPQTVAINPK